MGKQSTPKKGITPPKGRPTRSRHDGARRRRVFGPVAQWIGVVLFLLLLFVVLVIVTDGGDFNPFNDNQIGAAALIQPMSSGSLLHWM